MHLVRTVDKFNNIVRCNNCCNVYKEDELELIKTKEGEWIQACPMCNTDEYLQTIRSYNK